MRKAGGRGIKDAWDSTLPFPPLLPQNLSAFKQISLLLLNYEINYSFSVGADREFHV